MGHRCAERNTLDQRPHPVSIGDTQAHDGLDLLEVHQGRWSPDCIGKQGTAEGFDESFRFCNKRGLHARGSWDLPSVRELDYGFGCHALLGVSFRLSLRRVSLRWQFQLPPLSDAVKALERETPRIHLVMAGRAGRARAMGREALGQREPVLLLVVFRECPDVWRWGRRGRVEDPFKHPLTALHRARAQRIRGHRQDAGHAENAAAVDAFPGQSPELAMLDLGHAVVLRQPPIHEDVFTVEALKDAAILAHKVVEELDDLQAHGLAQALIERAVAANVRRDVAELGRAEPLGREVLGQRPRPRVVEHLLDDARHGRVAIEFV